MNKLIILGVLGLTLLSPGLVKAQKTISEDEQAWFAVVNTTRLSNRWGVWFDAHMRLKNDFVQKPSLFILRGGPTYFINNDLRLTAAYAFINVFPETAHPEVSRPEHRLWQQVQWFSHIQKARWMQWIRLEQRYRRNLSDNGLLADGYQFNWRMRFNGLLTIPLGKDAFKPGGLQGVVNNELMVNFGKHIRYNYFDQNRFFVGLGLQTAPSSQLQLGYLNVFVQSPAGDRFSNIHAVRMFYTHNFDFRKKTSS